MKKEEIIKIINEVKNPYPKDIFIWDNELKMDIKRGRFNEFIYRVVENMREEIIKEIEDV